LGIGLHAAVDALALVTVQRGWGLVATEGVVGVFGLMGLGIVLVFRPTGKEMPGEPRAGEALLPPLPSLSRRALTAEERLRQQIEESKYEG
jgi:hypothetical protein